VLFVLRSRSKILSEKRRASRGAPSPRPNVIKLVLLLRGNMKCAASTIHFTT
jgi:hypothetical protein